MSRPARVLVTGSRDWVDRHTIVEALDPWREVDGAPSVLVHGAAEGLDRAAAHFWTQWGLPVEPRPAKWAQHSWQDPAVASGLITGWECPDWHAGKRTCLKAGFRRNAEMVALGADVCLAFLMPCSKRGCAEPHPHSSHGAWGCAQLAMQAGIDTVTHKPAH